MKNYLNGNFLRIISIVNMIFMIFVLSTEILGQNQNHSEKDRFKDTLIKTRSGMIVVTGGGDLLFLEKIKSRYKLKTITNLLELDHESKKNKKDYCLESFKEVKIDSRDYSFSAIISKKDSTNFSNFDFISLDLIWDDEIKTLMRIVSEREIKIIN